jgi:hypothetical protein
MSMVTIAIAAVIGFGSVAQGEPRIVTFNLASGCDTEPVAINAKGLIVGNSYTDGEFCDAFVRLPDGTFQYFYGIAAAMNRKGEITGNDPKGPAFLRKADGSLTYFSLHIDGHKRESLAPAGINSEGTIAGTYTYVIKERPRQWGTSGFLRTADGNITVFGCPRAGSATRVTGINNLGATVGSVDSRLHEGCIRNPDGTSTVFDAGGETYPTAINDAGYVAGSVSIPNIGQMGFVRAPDGTVTLFDASPYCINAAGTTTGEHGNQGFVRTADGTMTTFEVDGATYTRPQSINDQGVITGNYLGNLTEDEGFIRFP